MRSEAWLVESSVKSASVTGSNEEEALANLAGNFEAGGEAPASPDFSPWPGPGPSASLDKLSTGASMTWIRTKKLEEWSMTHSVVIAMHVSRELVDS